MYQSYKQKLLDRFLSYVSIPSQSNTNDQTLPSSEGQMQLALLLEQELQKMGLCHIKLRENAILTAQLPATKKNIPSVGFIAHLDTVDVGLSPVINPQVLYFNGQDVLLNKEKNIVFKVDEHPEILSYKEDYIIFTDGTSVLGADNKAAIATIMTMLEYFIQEKHDHGDIWVAFLPDEEIGLRGAWALDLSEFPVKFAYTIDCCELGEVVFETFNAASAVIKIQGISAHPMSAKDVMVNPVLVAHDFIAQFDKRDTPECTENREGYIWVYSVKADSSAAEVILSIRDFDNNILESRKLMVQKAVDEVRKLYPKAKIEYKINNIYSNIANSLIDTMPVELLYQACQNLNIPINIISMRGGTDGSALSAKGLPTPNYFTGAHNFHSIYEFLPLKSFEYSWLTTLEIIKILATTTND
ncbi:tripeptide aminopeptidase [Brevinema andersonii]|uniref:Peptidase T n=1 Tax=Brevinema andersonii TaxID=34097 RepID=A0A1I1DGU4_BREAD|nr:peptidase T [Brevinema andersonii]SFB74165.1 tripeptide aminopeptidase [Brevinema andersonii]